jgi:hypothetical protein
LLHVWLATRVSQVRRQVKIGVGDGGNEALARRMRAHANYIENMPLMLILLFLLELATGGSLWLWGAALVFILARISHAFGMDRPGANRWRVAGISISMIVLVGLAAWAIFVAYQSPGIRGGIQISPGRSAASGLSS